ncbi:MAG: hypothetical protein LC637_10615 [Xanthomonadaceae bacterium]|nr:hypothetical protein [Xanthomonadaceae bacterium]
MPAARNESLQVLISRWLAPVSYVGLVVVAWWLEQPSYRALGMPLLAIAVVGVPRTWTTAGVVVAASLLACLVVLHPVLALWPPSLILLSLAALFAYSLGRARKPMIERFARVLEADRNQQLPPGAEPWMRRWTWVWVLILGGLGLGAAALAATDAAAWWIIWVVGVVPASMLLTLLVELRLRRHRFPQHPPWSLSGFVIAVARIRPHRLSS